MKWMINMRKSQPLQFLVNICVTAVETGLVFLCLVFMLVLKTTEGEDWYQTAVKLEIENDHFFTEKSEAMFFILSVSAVIVFVFIVVTTCILCRQKLNNMKQQIGVLKLCGFGQKYLKRLFFLDILLDQLVSVPFAWLVSVYGMLFLMKRKEFYVLIMSAGIGKSGFLFGFFASSVCILLIRLAYRNLWLNVRQNKNIITLLEER